MGMERGAPFLGGLDGPCAYRLDSTAISSQIRGQCRAAGRKKCMEIPTRLAGNWIYGVPIGHVLHDDHLATRPADRSGDDSGKCRNGALLHAIDLINRHFLCPQPADAPAATIWCDTGRRHWLPDRLYRTLYPQRAPHFCSPDGDRNR